MKDADPLKLDYANVNEITPTHVPYFIGLVCGIVPLGAGVLSLGLYAVTAERLYELTWFLTLLAGAICFVLGGICLAAYRRQARKASPDFAALMRKRFRIALFILLVNLPAAAVCTALGLSMRSGNGAAFVSLDNDGKTAITQLTITNGGIPLTVSSIARGKSVNLVTTQKNIRGATLSFTQNGKTRTTPLADPAARFDQVLITITDSQITALPIEW